MSFHQSAVTMTYFARDYTVPSVGKMTNLWFDLFGLLPIFLAAVGLFFAARKKRRARAVAGDRRRGVRDLRRAGLPPVSRLRRRQSLQPQKFQHFNPFFIVALTPVVVGIFAWLNRKGKEPSAPRKIGFGMLITAARVSHPRPRLARASEPQGRSAAESRRPTRWSRSTG